MAIRPTVSALIFLVLQPLTWAAQAGSYNECLSDKGITSLISMQIPCPPGSRLMQSGVDMPVPIDPRYPKLLISPRAIPDRTPFGDNDERIYSTLVVKRVCDAHMPGFREKSAAAYMRWASVHAEAISKIEHSPEFQAQIDNMQKSSGTDSERQIAQQVCSDSFVAKLQAELQPPDPKYSSPEATWKTFVAALRDANRGAAIDALDDDHERQKFEPTLKQLTDQQMRDMGNSFNGFKLGQSYEPFAEAWVSRTNGRVSAVTFIKVPVGWRISEM